MHRTTLVFSDTLWAKIRKIAADEGLSLSEFVSIAVQKGLEKKYAEKKSKTHFVWKSSKMGGLKVDVTSREGIYEIVSRGF